MLGDVLFHPPRYAYRPPGACDSAILPTLMTATMEGIVFPMH